MKGDDIVFMNNYLFADPDRGEINFLIDKMARDLAQWLVKPQAVLVTTAMLADDGLFLADTLDFPMGLFSW